MMRQQHTQREVTALLNEMPTQATQDLLDISAGVIGGSIGVMGTLAALEVKKNEVRERAQVCRVPSLVRLMAHLRDSAAWSCPHSARTA
jgi:hypothetical protein